MYLLTKARYGHVENFQFRNSAFGLGLGFLGSVQVMSFEIIHFRDGYNLFLKGQGFLINGPW